MVFFVCEGCNESLKKNQVDKHARQCRKCAAVTCVDCSVTFYGDDYAAHISCVSEAEKYEKSLYKAKPGSDKLKPQDIWIALIENIESYSDKASPTVRPFLSRLAALNNVPRNKKKFQNFAKNSMKIRSDHILEEIWNFVESIRQQNEAATAITNTPAAAPSSSAKTSSVSVEEPAVIEEADIEELDKQRKKEMKEKKKKRKLAEDAEAAADAEVAQDAIITEDVPLKKSRFDNNNTLDEEHDDETAAVAKKHKKDKKDKKKRKQEEQ